MKSTIKLGSLEFNGVKLNNVEFTQEYSANEAVKMAGLFSNIIKKLPETLEDLKVAFDKFNEIDKQVRKQERTLEEKYIELKNRINKLQVDFKYAVNNNWSKVDVEASGLIQEKNELCNLFEEVIDNISAGQRFYITEMFIKINNLEKALY